MNKYYLTENNSNGYTEYLDCIIENSGRPHCVIIEASNVHSAINKLKKHIKGFNYEYQNSYEGNSCNCCGRRFDLYSPLESEADYGILNISYYKNVPYMADETKYRVVELKDAPKNLKRAENA